MDSKKIGARHLRRWLTQSHVTQTALAKQLETHQSHVSKILRGRRKVGLDLAVKIRAITGIPIEVWLPPDNGDMRMTEDQKTSPAEIPPDATVETRQKKYENLADRLLFSPRDHSREDQLLGEIIRICLAIDKAGFAKIYATAKAEEVANAARVEQNVKQWRGDAPEK